MCVTLAASFICAGLVYFVVVGERTRDADVQDVEEVVVTDDIRDIVIAAVDARVRERDRALAHINGRLLNNVGNIPGQYDEIAKMCKKRNVPADLMTTMISRGKNVVGELQSLPEGVQYRLISTGGQVPGSGGFTVYASLPVLDQRSHFAVCIVTGSREEPTSGGVMAFLLSKSDRGWKVVDDVVLAVF